MVSVILGGGGVILSAARGKHLSPAAAGIAATQAPARVSGGTALPASTGTVATQTGSAAKGQAPPQS